MKVLYCYMDESNNIHTEIRDIIKELKVYQRLVDGYIETYPLTEDLIIVLDDEGKLKSKPITALALSLFTNSVEPIAGDFFICRTKDSDFTDIDIERDIESIKGRIIIINDVKTGR